ncbi:hypothetical protein M569_09135, partial [Genlisea aurea]
ARQAEQLKLDGNVYYKKDRIGAAIDAYTEAIALCPNVPIYWTNRALCHRKRNDWSKVEDDCRRALELDRHSVKAHYMLGQALLQRKDYADGVKELEKAMDLGRGADPVGYMVEDIWQQLARSKYLAWDEESAKRSIKRKQLKEACETALNVKYALDLSSTEVSGEEKNPYPFGELIEDLHRLFEKAAEDDAPSEARALVPEYLCCQISLDIFRDPVITPSGITYERAVILNHLKKVGKFDPLTREPLHASQLVPNLAIKEAVRSYLEKHGWAYKMD